MNEISPNMLYSALFAAKLELISIPKKNKFIAVIVGIPEIIPAILGLICSATSDKIKTNNMLTINFINNMLIITLFI